MSENNLKTNLTKKIIQRYGPTLKSINESIKKQPADDGFFHIPVKQLSEGGFSENIPGKNEKYSKPDTVAVVQVKPNIVFGKEINYTIALDWKDLEYSNNSEQYFKEYFDFIFNTALLNYVKHYGHPSEILGRDYCKLVFQKEDDIFLDDGSGDVLYIILRGYIASDVLFRE